MIKILTTYLTAPVKCLFILLLASFSRSFLYAQTNASVQADGSRFSNVLTSVPFLLITPQARSGAMGNAGVAMEGDANSASINTAALAYRKEDSFGLSINYSPWLKNLTEGMSRFLNVVSSDRYCIISRFGRHNPSVSLFLYR
ncbi:hypothetical protein [Pedobacter sp.]|uniref:hypothetical protein n=1 Tax=Pedobacter sp. TaxID=1411316 RepID=UPI003D0E67A2